jgi:RNA polymerase sigma factor (sigma-70 family)
MTSVVDSRLIIRLAERASLEAAGPRDADLLSRFHSGRDEAAFELLVRRHGGMVYRVCRGRLGNDADAADVFQATFLALARAAGRIHATTSLAGWLYRVAFRLANKLRSRIRPTVELMPNHPAVDGDPAHVASQREEIALLWAEIDRLPHRYRDAVLLCLIEGKTRAQAADELRCPGGTIDSRLAWARERLRERLLRRGLAPAVVVSLIATLTAEASALPPRLVAGFSRIALLVVAAGPEAVGGAVSPQTVSLLRSMGSIMTRMRSVVVVTMALALGLVSVAIPGWLDRPAAAEGPPPAASGKATEAGEWRYLGAWRVGKGPVTSLMFAPGTSLLLANGGTEMQILAMPSGKAAVTWRLDPPVHGVAFSPDGKLIATSDAEGHTTLWSADSGKQINRPKKPSDRMTSLAFSPDGKHLFYGTTDGGVRVWDLARWPSDAADPFGARTGPIDSLAFTPDGQRLYTSGDGTVRVWDAKTGKQLVETADWARGKRDVAVTPDGKRVAVAGPTQVTLIDTQTGKIVRTIDFPSAGLRADKDICTVVCLPDGRTLAVGCNPFLSDEPAGVGAVRFFDLTTGQKTGELTLPAGFVVKVAVSADGHYLAVGAHDGTVHAWQRVSAPAPAQVRSRSASPARLAKLADDLATSSRPPEQCVEALFLAALGRFPSDTESQFASTHVSKATQRREAMHDVLWQLVNTREFAEHVSQLHSPKPKPAR